MGEGDHPTEEIQRDKKKAETFARKNLPLVKNPVAHFNLAQQDHWQPTEESGLPPLPSYDTEGVVEALKNPEKISDPETGQQFRVVKLNWQERESLSVDQVDNPQQRPLMYIPEYGWSAAHEGPIQLRLEELVRQTGRPVFSIDHPGWGSDNLTEEQKKALKTDEGYGPIAEAQLRVMKEMGIKDVDLVGISMGAWSAASLAEKAEQEGIKVHNLVVMESPGVEEMSATKLMSGEISEAKRLELYHSMPYDVRLRELSGHFKSAFRRNIDLVKWGLGGMKAGGSKYIQAMGRETLGNHLGKAIESNPDLHVQVMNGTDSKVSPSGANASLVNALQERFPERIHQSVFPGDSHSFGENPQRFASVVRLALEPSSQEK